MYQYFGVLFCFVLFLRKSIFWNSFSERYSTIWTSHTLFIHSPVGEHLGYFLFGAINTKSAIGIHIQLLGRLFSQMAVLTHMANVYLAL